MGSTDTWNPAQYERFRDERSRPFLELLDLLGTPAERPDGQPVRVVDLGCGTGELTRTLHERLRGVRSEEASAPAGTGASTGSARTDTRVETLGVDSSQAMLAKAVQQAGNGLRFQAGDIREWAETVAAGASPGERYDVIFSNAALQWVEDHPGLIAHLTQGLAEGGQLAVQVPANGDHASHLAAAEVAREEPFRSALGGHVRIFPILAPEEYATLLDRLGFREQHVRLQVFGYHLGSREDVVEWVKGTLLTDYQKRLPGELWERFLARYREVLLPRLEETRPYFYAFKRILLWGRK